MQSSLDAAPRLPAEASTLPPRAYVDPAVYATEVERIFRREWICVAREDQLVSPGDYISLDLFAEPLVAVRGDDGEIRVLSRVCRHRWMPVVAGSGNRRSFQCPYHLWTYALDGRLLGAPDMERTAGFDRSSCRLPSLRVEVWEGFVFVNFDADAAPLAPRLAGLSRVVAPYRPAAMRTTAPLVYEHVWNWKVMVDNFIESYHHAGTHADTLQPLVPGSGTHVDDAESDAYAILHNPTKEQIPIPAVFAATQGLSDAQRAEFVVGVVFPFLLFSVQQDSLIWYRIEPRAFDRFALHIYLCVPPDAAAAPEYEEHVAVLKGYLDGIHRQDIVACEGVWQGLQSRFATIGPLSHLEKAIVRFDRFVRSRVEVS